MRKERRLTLLAAIACLALVLETGAAPAAKERYWAIIDEQGGSPLQLTISISDWTSEQEGKTLYAALKSGGDEALRNALWKQNKGFLALTGSLGWPIQYAKAFPQGTSTQIMIVTDRPIGMVEARVGGTTMNYLFGVIQLLVDANGKGTGTAIFAATITVDEKGGLHVNPYGAGPYELMGVRRQK